MGSDSAFGEPVYEPIDLTPDDVRRKMDAHRTMALEDAYRVTARVALVAFLVGAMIGSLLTAVLS